MEKDKANQGKKDAAPGQSKLHVMTNTATGETRTITQADWKQNRATYLAQGFTRPDSVEDSGD